MSQTFIITGTDTGIGKTVFAAALTNALNATYWKPIQCGMEGGTDSSTISRLTNCTVLKEAYCLKMAASPHLAAEAEGMVLSPDAIALPAISGPLVLEGAGGVMVPLNRETLLIEQFARWNAPGNAPGNASVILCARTVLGTINHSLLSIKALRDAGCEVLGIAFIGEENQPVEETICDFGKVKRLGRLPFLDSLNKETLQAAFNDGFDLSHFNQPASDNG